MTETAEREAFDAWFRTQRWFPDNPRAVDLAWQVWLARSHLDAERTSTHADGCWQWGPKHYDCALAKIRSDAERVAAVREECAKVAESFYGDPIEFVRASEAATNNAAVRQIATAIRALSEQGHA